MTECNELDRKLVDGVRADSWRKEPGDEWRAAAWGDICTWRPVKHTPPRLARCGHPFASSPLNSFANQTEGHYAEALTQRQTHFENLASARGPEKTDEKGAGESGCGHSMGAVKRGFVEIYRRQKDPGIFLYDDLRITKQRFVERRIIIFFTWRF